MTQFLSLYLFLCLQVPRISVFCLINCLPCNKQFRIFHLGIRYTVFSFGYKRGISLILSTLFWVFRFVVLSSNIPWIIPYRSIIAKFKCCFGYTKVNFFFITRNISRDICLVDNTHSKTMPFLAGYLDVFFIFFKMFLLCLCISALIFGMRL